MPERNAPQSDDASPAGSGPGCGAGASDASSAGSGPGCGAGASDAS
eukprot:CAMPEP_0204524092 /NCGR_PEP_ID=MMETSP0661-20131031/7192_1 /ASSEMBLY_ACC=CAM_ASM_000606 /TAXON_ID=109239 /ORGANISM="Alexandrium margalefi, Strain AMGDE01CS-322" /LENGTH=45 /DNA_ID= /DNA_START= /DNA_END= /DNA_ORIENTATION=